MVESTSARLDLGGDHPVNIHAVTLSHPWLWLAAGWKDLRQASGPSVAYGAIWVLISLVLVGGLWLAGQGSWLLPLFAGFMLMGPIVAVGLYDMSQRLARGETPDLRAALLAWRANATQIFLMGLMLMIFLLAWIRFATLLFALFFGTSIPTVEAGQVYSELLLSAPGLGMIVVGSLIGMVLAFAAFALSVVSIPRLIDEPETSVLEAAIISLSVVQKNLAPMLLWGVILSGVTFLGLALGIIGLAVTLPLLGHASWHAYRDLVSEGERRAG
ncbi:DUF2189 domain-containing protein [Natronospira bacteriovora]|uniref:DUF2189 domain-containing protein n=1 Tax=Natronospira bacteriovora TaxID=3069753 RepID=A0ABU0W9S8_9GAMM|nr:DUF2189 domain-containing protein [Natronospira sp. AB-CW4]MDQ2070789.1 DUF2189 domain-containing protein [Natronospira sp. AB-CW4]